MTLTGAGIAGATSIDVTSAVETFVGMGARHVGFRLSSDTAGTRITVGTGGGNGKPLLSSDAFPPSLGTFAGHDNSGASVVSADGSVIVGTANSGGPSDVFRWTSDDVMIGLQALPGLTHCIPRDISADGSIVVGQCRSSSKREAVLWKPDGTIHLIEQLLTEDLGIDLSGWVLDTAYGVSDDGRRIVGTGSGPDGTGEGWIATIPEPGSPLVMFCGALVIICLHGRKEHRS